ncbi:hypothetical protein LJC27_04670 [Christensenellaceae bacterium OttesenSCG-928-M15]|nr:hypothetical protein [Christensenellaceae bacterium OttesenSCG-928-M15]
MIKKSISLILCALLLLGVLAGCSRNTEDIMGMVGETPIYRWYYNAYLLEQLDAYKRDIGVDLTEVGHASELKKYKEYRLDDLVGRFALYEEARVRGLVPLTSEQEAEVDEMYNEYYTAYMESLYEQYGADESGKKEAEKEYLRILEERTLSPERLRENYRIAYVVDLVIREIAGETMITDEQIKAYYDAAVINEAKSIEEDPAWFGTHVSDATVVVPEGYVETARISVKFTDVQQARIASATRERDVAIQNEINKILSGGNIEEGASLQSEAIDKAEAELEAEYNDCYEELVPTIQEIRERILNGEDFIKTMEKESNDKRLISYYVSKDSTHVDDAYKEAALALQNVGDVSEPVRIKDGLCIITLMEKMPSGVRSYEDAYDDIKTHLAREASYSINNQLIGEYKEKAYDEGIVELHYEKLA